MTEAMLSHERSGAQVRAALSPRVFAALAALTPTERGVALDYVQTAIVREHRGEPLAGASYLTRTADTLGPCNLADALRQAASTFVRPAP
jgi:hypothetical protein